MRYHLCRWWMVKRSKYRTLWDPCYYRFYFRRCSINVNILFSIFFNVPLSSTIRGKGLHLSGLAQSGVTTYFCQGWHNQGWRPTSGRGDTIRDEGLLLAEVTQLGASAYLCQGWHNQGWGLTSVRAGISRSEGLLLSVLEQIGDDGLLQGLGQLGLSTYFWQWAVNAV